MHGDTMSCARYSDFAAWAVTFMLVTAVAGQAGAGEVWVTNMVSANVQVIDPDTMAVVATIPADKGAHNVTFSHDGKLAFIANTRANNVTIIDAVGKKVLGTVPTGRKAHQVSVSPDGTLAVSSNKGTDFVTLIDVKAMQPIGEITIADGAVGSVFSPDGTKLYVTNSRAAIVSVVDVEARQVTGTLPGGKDAFIPTSDWSQAWATAPDEGKILLIDVVKGELAAEIPVPGVPHGMALSPDGGSLYVVQYRLNKITVIDTTSRKIVNTASLGNGAEQVAISPDGEHLFVVIAGDKELVKLSASDLSVEGVARLSLRPHGVAYRP